MHEAVVPDVGEALYDLAPNELLAAAGTAGIRTPAVTRGASRWRCGGRAVIHVEDVEGRVFIDCLAGAGSLALGHNHPVVVAAIRQVLADELPLLTLDLTTPVKDRFVQDLLAVLPPAFAAKAKVQFCGPTGADAVEAALKLARTATGRRNVLAFQGGYHGMSLGALALMGNHGPKQALDGLFGNACTCPFPTTIAARSASAARRASRSARPGREPAARSRGRCVAAGGDHRRAGPGRGRRDSRPHPTGCAVSPPSRAGPAS